jgi:hypothetical protein
MVPFCPTRLTGLLGVIALTACGSSPQSLGITGPGSPPAAAPGVDSAVPPPGIPNTGNTYRYNVGPAEPGDRYFDYN